MSKAFVYLAGPILHATQGEANDWRYQAHDYFRNVVGRHVVGEIVGISPLRREPLHGPTYNLETKQGGGHNAIAAKNYFDVQSADLVLAYLPEGTFSRGTYLEIGWAKSLAKPVVLVSEDEETRNHPVVRWCAGWVYDNLPDAFDGVVDLLGGYVGGKNV
jgi:nucleoside 2-deoxyribosyltransferase